MFRLSTEHGGPSWVWHQETWKPFPMSADEVRALLGFVPLTHEDLVQRGIEAP